MGKERGEERQKEGDQKQGGGGGESMTSQGLQVV